MLETNTKRERLGSGRCMTNIVLRFKTERSPSWTNPIALCGSGVLFPIPKLVQIICFFGREDSFEVFGSVGLVHLNNSFINVSFLRW